MGKTTIEWTATRLENGTVLPGYTFNPWWGCLKVSPGCEHCYADTLARRYGFDVWGPAKTTSRRMMSENYWKQPHKWNRDAEADGVRRRVFCASMADVFEDHPNVEAARRRLFELIGSTMHLDWLLLTKRPENILRFLPETWGGNVLLNMWLGTSVENQAQAEKRIPELLKVPATVRFLSCEPLLGAITLPWCPSCGGWGDHDCYAVDDDSPAIDWVIAGGESGPQARPMHPDWARSIRDQCQAAGVPFLFKQWGNWWPAVWFDGPDAEADNGDAFVDLDRVDHEFLANDGRTWDTMGGRHMYPPLPLGHWCLMVNKGKKAAGRLLDGREWNEVPA